MVAALFLLGAMDALAPFHGERKALAFAAGITMGAFVAALPARLRHRGRFTLNTTWQRCLRGFLCGAVMALALALAGDGRILPAILTGSAGGCAFGMMALLTGFVITRIMGRARA